jgi:maleylpyruvate isomerase
MDDTLDADIAGMRAAHETLVARTRGLTDGRARASSRLPGWTVGHVLTHIARNGDSVARRLEGAARGEVVDQYPGGREGRAAEIEAGAGRPAAELLDDLAATHRRIDAAVDALAGDAWDGLTRGVGGDPEPARDVIPARWREVEVHHVDLGLGYEPDQWPAAFVERVLPEALADVGPRLPGLDAVDPAMVLAWTYGRATPPPGLPELLPF